MSLMSRRRFLQAVPVAAGAGVAATLTGASAEEGTSYSLQGIDVSHWQGTINWGSVRAAGKRYAFCKATEGLDYTDPRFSTNWPAMKAQGILRSAYHMGRPLESATAQADFFFDTVSPASGDLPLVLDLEKTDSQTPTAVRAWLVAFVNRLKTRMGKAPIIYTGFYFWRDQAGNGDSLGCPLWLAAYNNTPIVPVAWSAFTLWQYTASGSCGGIVGNVDLDAFNGSKTALNNLRLP